MQKQVVSLKQNHNLIVVAKDQIAGATFAELESEIVSLLVKANLYKDEKNI